MSSISIAPVRTSSDVEASIGLAKSFFDFARAVTACPNMVENDLADHQVLEKSAEFDQHYLPPMGDCLLARLPDGLPVGTVMLTAKSPERCEMNRMFVDEAARGLGAERLLGEGILRRGAEMGFTETTLDTLVVMESAVHLSHALGFVDDTRPGLYDADNPMTVQLRRSLADCAP